MPSKLLRQYSLKSPWGDYFMANYPKSYQERLIQNNYRALDTDDTAVTVGGKNKNFSKYAGMIGSMLGGLSTPENPLAATTREGIRSILPSKVSLATGAVDFLGSQLGWQINDMPDSVARRFNLSTADTFNNLVSSIPGLGTLAGAFGTKTDQAYLSEYTKNTSGYTASLKDINAAQALSGKNFLFGGSGVNDAIKEANRQDLVISNISKRAGDYRDNVMGEIQTIQNRMIFGGHAPGKLAPAIHAKEGAIIPTLSEVRQLLLKKEITKFKSGGVIKQNVIPIGALHKNKHHLEEVRPELEGQITEKGIPVVSSDVADNVTQIAEVEAGEITFAKPITEQIEGFYKRYKENESDEIAVEFGKFLVEQILHNTVDKGKIIKQTA